jgi:hypothetical protein
MCPDCDSGPPLAVRLRALLSLMAMMGLLLVVVVAVVAGDG